jgi:hypothetical protein
MDSSRWSSDEPRICVRHVRCGRISGLCVEDRDLLLLANMDSRAPQANRGDGVKRQGCYRPDAVSVGSIRLGGHFPKGGYDVVAVFWRVMFNAERA